MKIKNEGNIFFFPLPFTNITGAQKHKHTPFTSFYDFIYFKLFFTLFLLTLLRARTATVVNIQQAFTTFNLRMKMFSFLFFISCSVFCVSVLIKNEKEEKKSKPDNRVERCFSIQREKERKCWLWEWTH